ncbi:MAG: POTRA domain-containing protein [Candidatus Omnitrophica bacterium]|nr:POTRA domain-containing protein [Candidatus Omnitrophota bacterium]MDD5592594.1 POTRA domain-containing protein [Candidatus Omnitrophota bacterium]
MASKISIYLFLACLLFFPKSYAWAATTPEQEMRSQELQEKDQALREKIETPRKAPEVKEELPAPPAAPTSTEKVSVKKINVTGVTLIAQKEINKIVLPFENQDLSLRELQRAADLITDIYRQRGYITSRAYLPPQRIEQGVVEVRVMEGTTGDIEVRGNRYFKTALLKRKIALKKGEPFNYNILRKGLTKINEQPDRFARTVLTPGREPGATDVVLEVKDKLPIHVGFDGDNFGSRYIDKQRYSVRFTHNNLLGLDDKLAFQYQLGQASRYFFKSIRYLFPVTSDLEAGAYAAFSRVKLGQELEDSGVFGKTQIYSLFANQSLVDEENFNFNISFGFDYKDIANYQASTITSHDKLRVARFGLDTDLTDNFGRTVFTNELDFGIPNIMGGLKKQDTQASRSGSGGTFIKDVVNLIRLQKMPFSSQLLWKNQIQFSPNILTSAEEFQIGGIANVRGYPPAEAVGDRGYATTFEWSFPFYPCPKEIKVPLSQAKLYDALRLAMFYDLANTRLKRPSTTEEKNKTLSSLGCGLRFNLPEDFSLRLDIAWPLDNTPSDGDHAHTWVQVSKTF